MQEISTALKRLYKYLVPYCLLSFSNHEGLTCRDVCQIAQEWLPENTFLEGYVVCLRTRGSLLNNRKLNVCVTLHTQQWHRNGGQVKAECIPKTSWRLVLTKVGIGCLERCLTTHCIALVLCYKGLLSACLHLVTNFGIVR